MITFKSIGFKNFLSVGNNPIKIDLNTCQSTLIVGKNGSGKSIIADAITFALFGKSFRKINKTQILNSINSKECLVEILLDFNGVEYKIVRGIKPNILDIYVDGNLRESTASTRDNQEWLETTLQLNYKTFTHVVILGNSNYTPFMEKSAADRRNFVEDVLGLTESTSLKNATKETIKNLQSELKGLLLKKNSLVSERETILSTIENIHKMVSSQKVDNEDKKNKIKDDIIFKKSQILDIYQNIQSKKEDLANLGNPEDKLSTLESKRYSLLANKQRYTEDILIYKENDTCPTCSQPFDINTKKQKFLKIKGDIENLLVEIETINGEIEEHQLLLQQKKNILEEISNYETEVKIIKNDILTLAESIKDFNKPSVEIDLTELEDKQSVKEVEIEVATKDISSIEDDIKTHTSILESYEPVKRQTIDRYLVYINETIKNILNELGLPISFKFDNEFQESIETPNKEVFTYPSFSEGEKMRINLAMLLTWRELCKSKNSFNTNLLILDEVCDSSLDVEGMNIFLDLIKSLEGNIIIISHREEVVGENFDRVLKISKNRTTTMTEE